MDQCRVGVLSNCFTNVCGNEDFRLRALQSGFSLRALQARRQAAEGDWLGDDVLRRA
jgi:hypothetical protein